MFEITKSDADRAAQALRARAGQLAQLAFDNPSVPEETRAAWREEAERSDALAARFEALPDEPPKGKPE